ncbi:MAG: hypothetical protein LC803_09295 [Acidobacteria bacterium]|nr:hypothetical protein [Acidobacteriota bacterium]
MDKLPEYRKAVAAFLVGMAGFLTVTLPLVTDGVVTNNDIVAVLGALAAWVGGTVAVERVPNAPYTGK